MKYDLSNKVQVIKFDAWVKRVKEKEKFVNGNVIHPMRSDQQNKYFHVLVGYFSSEYGETTEYVKQTIFKKWVNKEIFKTEYANKKTGEIREEWRSSADLSTGELTLAIERFRDYASKEANIYLPEPNEDEFLRHCETEIERQKQYL